MRWAAIRQLWMCRKNWRRAKNYYTDNARSSKAWKNNNIMKFMKPHESKWESLRNILFRIGLRSNQCKGEILHRKSLKLRHKLRNRIFRRSFCMKISATFSQWPKEKKYSANPLKHFTSAHHFNWSVLT